MSLLIRAALLGGLAYVVSRAVRHSQRSLDFSRSQEQRLTRGTDNDVSELLPMDPQPSTSNV